MEKVCRILMGLKCSVKLEGPHYLINTSDGSYFSCAEKQTRLHRISSKDDTTRGLLICSHSSFMKMKIHQFMS